MKKKVLLLNPPGKDIYIRDYYCSKTTQADYLIPPLDLLFASARLYGRYEISVIDAVAEKLNIESCLKKCGAFSPDAIISLVGAVSWTEDVDFIRRLRSLLGIDVRIIVSGDLLRDEAEKRFEELPAIDAAIFDFMNEDALKIIEGDFDKVESAAFRRKTDGVVVSVKKKFACAVGDYPTGIPRHEFFINKNYRHPFSRGKKFATLLTEFGCPYKCSFCIIGTLPYKRRPVNEVVSEIKYIKSLGINEIFVATQTFGVSKAYALELCRKIIDEKIGWFTFSRVDVVDEELLSAMKQAGCHTIIFGVESGSEEILKHYRKGYDKARIKNILEICAALKISTVGTFILGLPEDNDETLSETLEFIKNLPLDYASFNVAVPRHGTALRDEAFQYQLVKSENGSSYDGSSSVVMDQSGSRIAMGTKTLSPYEVLQFRRKMVRAFYLSPRYILRRLKKLRSPAELFSHIKQGISLIKRTWS